MRVAQGAATGLRAAHGRAARAGALLAGFFFLGDTPKGPPFGIERAELDALLAPYFTLLDDQPVEGSLPVFVGRERWLTWQRNDTAVVPHSAG